MRRSPYFRLLALVLAFMLLRIPLLARIGLVQPASAAVDPCSPSADRILQDICVDGMPSPALIHFEQDTVNAWLTAHKMPLSNAGLIYQHGRGDLRSLIRATMLTRIEALIYKSDLTAEEQFVLGWFRQRVQDKEVGVFQYAVDERDRWESDPCHWRPDPQIADAYGLHYTGGAFCAGGLLTLFSTQPQVPDKSYFLAAGFKESYGSGIAGSPGGPQALAQTSENMLPTLGLAALYAGVAAFGTATLIAAGIESIFIYHASIIGTILGLAVVGPAIVVFFAIFVGVVAAFELFQGQQTLDELAELDTMLAHAQSSSVNLAALARSNEGQAKLTMTFVEATLPEFSSTSTLPARESDDALFYVGHMGAPPSTVTADLTYQDWEGDVWTATPSRGFFVQHGTENGNPVTSFSPMLRIIDPNTEEKLTADLVGSNFLVARAHPRLDQTPCIPNPFTGLSDASDLSTCSSYVVPEINLRDGNGDQETVTLAVLPAFTSLPSATFTQGVAKTFDITATGPPLPSISVAGSLPAGFEFASIGDNGVGLLAYDGTNTPPGSYPVVIHAINDRGAASQTFTILIGTELAFTSTATPTFVAEKFGSFLITTSGAPPPSIHLPIIGGFIHNCLPCGLSLTDNGDGTATVSGTSPGGIFCSENPCNIRAENGIDMVDQNFQPVVVPPPRAHLISASSTTFFAGVLNSFGFVTEGAETPVTISLPCGQGTAGTAPGWVSLNDHHNGTATLFGVPPFGTDGAFSILVDVFTEGQGADVPFCNQPNFTIHVSNVPTFLSPNRAQFGPPPITGTVYLVTTNQASGLISLEGALPAGVSFFPTPAHGDATIQGLPKVGTGGVYPLLLSMTNAAGTGSQYLRLLVKEAPTFEGAFDSAVFYVGQENSFPVPTTGFPKLPELIGNENPVELAMHIGLSGALPPGVSFTDANQLDIPTGTGLFTGIPDAGSEGVYPLTLTADNGVLPAAHLDFTLYVVKPGDVNRDGVVDNRDADVIGGSLGKTLADPDYDPLIDTNHDGIIDEQDFQFVADACGDPDGDGACESATADRDGDGIPDAEDYDPTGYLYDRDTGEILSGGKVIITPAPASMPFDGSGGFYQFFVAPGETVYTLTVQAPPGCRQVGCPRLDPPPLDPVGMSVWLGSSEVGNTGHLASAACSDNPYTLTLRLGEVGDAVLLDNIPFDCTPLAQAAPALDARGILLAVLLLFGVAALGFRRRRGPGGRRLQR